MKTYFIIYLTNEAGREYLRKELKMYHNVFVNDSQTGIGLTVETSRALDSIKQLIRRFEGSDFVERFTCLVVGSHASLSQFFIYTEPWPKGIPPPDADDSLRKKT